MPFSASDFRDWLSVLYEHPEWQEELRRLILTAELLQLPAIVRELAEAQRRTEQRLEELAAAVSNLAESQRRLEQRFEALAEAQRRADQRIEQLAEAQRRTDQRLEELAAAVQALAEAQRRADQRIEQLAEAQRRTDQRLEELAAAVQVLAEAQRRADQRIEQLVEAQRRTDRRLEELAAAVQALAEAQRRTDQRVDELARTFIDLKHEVGVLSSIVGATLEEEAASVVAAVLRRKGYRVVRNAFSLALNGEVDVVLPVEDTAGRAIWVVVEAKARLSTRDVAAWARRLRSSGWQKHMAERGCPGPFLAYFYGIRADLGAQDLIEAEGLGLLKSDGEVIAPRALIEPLVR